MLINDDEWVFKISEYLFLLIIELSQARQDAFDLFRKNYADTTNINEHKKMLKIK